MRAIHCEGFGDPHIMRITEQPMPVVGPEQLLIRVKACALNRADLLQRKGKYPPPVGASSILGLELAGEVVELGAHVKGFKIGDRVCGLVPGGAYAQFCVLDQTLAFAMPDNLSFVEAAAIPEAFITANETIFELGQLKAGENVLIHAAGSGVGTTALQMAKLRGAAVYVTAGSPEKIQRLLELGATAGINYKQQDFLTEILQLTHAKGVNVIEDFIGGENLGKNLQALMAGGRLVQVAHMGGRHADIDLSLILRKQLQIKGFVLRSRSAADKAAMAQRFTTQWLPEIAKRNILPVIDSTFMLEEAAAAHQHMEDNRNFGKIVLIVE